jgi:hypothetical protein
MDSLIRKYLILIWRVLNKVFARHFRQALAILRLGRLIAVHIDNKIIVLVVTLVTVQHVSHGILLIVANRIPP